MSDTLTNTSSKTPPKPIVDDSFNDTDDVNETKHANPSDSPSRCDAKSEPVDDDPNNELTQESPQPTKRKRHKSAKPGVDTVVPEPVIESYASDSDDDVNNDSHDEGTTTHSAPVATTTNRGVKRKRPSKKDDTKRARPSWSTDLILRKVMSILQLTDEDRKISSMVMSVHRCVFGATHNAAVMDALMGTTADNDHKPTSVEMSVAVIVRDALATNIQFPVALECVETDLDRMLKTAPNNPRYLQSRCNMNWYMALGGFRNLVNAYLSAMFQCIVSPTVPDIHTAWLSELNLARLILLRCGDEPRMNVPSLVHTSMVTHIAKHFDNPQLALEAVQARLDHGLGGPPLSGVVLVPANPSGGNTVTLMAPSNPNDANDDDPMDTSVVDVANSA
jgi:hypothetical protein